MIGLLIKVAVIYPLRIAWWMFKMPIYIMAKLLLGPLLPKRKSTEPKRMDDWAKFGWYLMARGR